MELKNLGIYNGKKIFFTQATQHLDSCRLDQVPTTFMACLLLAKDWSSHDKRSLERFLASLIAGGSVFLGLWGEHSEWVHDLADDLLLLDHPTARAVPIPTSWENENRVEQELWHFVFSYDVDDRFVEECSWVVISVDASIDHTQISKSLKNLTEKESGN